MKKKFILTSLMFSILLLGYISVSHFSKKFKFIGQYLSRDQIVTIKKLIFPYKYIGELENEIVLNKKKNKKEKKLLRERLVNINLLNKKYNHSYVFHKSSNQDLNHKNYQLINFQNINDIVGGITNDYPGSAYLDYYDNKLYLTTSSGNIAYTNLDLDKEKLKFVQINNNIDKFLSSEQLKKHKSITIKDILIADGKFIASYLEEMKSDCWTISIIIAEINYEDMKFKKLFSPGECVNKKEAWNTDFSFHQTGGRIVKLNSKEILFTTGEYRSRHLAQKSDSIFGKLIKINIEDSSYSIVAKGFRNAQGLYYDKEYNFALLTEHGPQGGDEINLIDLNLNKINQIPNYGWPKASYGIHYGGLNGNILYDKFPLYENHKDFGFVEPLKVLPKWTGVSNLVKIGDKSYVVASMAGKKLFFIDLNEKNEIKNFDTVKIHSRVRDVISAKGYILLYFEDDSSIGIIMDKNL